MRKKKKRKKEDRRVKEKDRLTARIEEQKGDGKEEGRKHGERDWEQIDDRKRERRVRGVSEKGYEKRMEGWEEE